MKFLPEAHPTTPKGFAAARHTCGIKASGKPDLALLVSEAPCRWTAAFTTNKVAAAPVLFGRERLAEGKLLRAVLVNSGNANACTGEEGLSNARKSAEALEMALGIEAGETIVSSTGIIGHQMPMDKILAGIPEIAKLTTVEGGVEFAEAIMTTDTHAKHCGAEVTVAGGTAFIGGCAKGAGMIHPRLATMLSYITTDALVHPEVLDGAFRRGLEKSFNRVSVDGDTSTNDTCVLLSNGRSGLPEILPATPEAADFEEALHAVMIHLAREIARDGEGATTLVEVKVSGAKTPEQAETVGRAIVNSPLVKTAVHGADPNWGRVLCAAGYSGGDIKPEQCALTIQDVTVLRRGTPLEFDAAPLSQAMKGKDVRFHLTLGEGPYETVFWTCDFSKEYVAINADYST
jgi:glutamate N-acetyltransferase/amino-acid N-acetyltransferase